ncbi:MAG: hypothetical protein NTU53_07330 [Planctomycetota bacterium]|nr:hypothetical protein [Planctomycetota bacterium]
MTLTDQRIPAEGMGTGEAPALPKGAAGKNGWTIVLISIGINLIACCLLIPQADENRQQLYECEKLSVDLGHVKKQSQMNEEFIKQMNEDPALAERLAQRQLHLIRKGMTVLEMPGVLVSEGDRSPFVLVSVSRPPPMPACPKIGGKLAEVFRDSRNRLYLIGGGLMLVATGLVLGSTPKADGAV